MRHEEEINFLQNLGRGKKARGDRPYFTQRTRSEKYQNYRKGESSTVAPPRKTVDMLRTAQKKTQAIYKISSYGKGQNRIQAHLRYISRNSKLELEDHYGNKYTNSSERKELLKNWSIDFGNNERSRDTMHLVLSTPPGSNREEALKAAKEFLAEEYGSTGHEYVFVAHKDTDHPHVHAVVKMMSTYGKKLNPRKAYLRMVREHFAERCREHGIEVEASSRAERGLCGASKRSEFVQMKRTNRKPYVDIELIRKIKNERNNNKDVAHPSDEKMIKRNQIIRKRYAEKAKKLAQKASELATPHEREKYREASKVLEEYAKEMPIEETRGEKLHQKLDIKYGAPLNRLSLREKDINENPLNQYHAVTAGLKNEKGIYQSLKQMLTKKVSQAFAKQASKSQQHQLERSLELEIDD